MSNTENKKEYVDAMDLIDYDDLEQKEFEPIDGPERLFRFEYAHEHITESRTRFKECTPDEEDENY